VRVLHLGSPHVPTHLRAGIHFHHRIAAGSLRRRHRGDPDLKASQWERERHQDRAARVKAVLNAAGLPVMPNETRIVPVMVGNPECAGRPARSRWCKSITMKE
jgi:hypothetical protein